MSYPNSANDPGVPVDGLPGGPNYKGSQGYSDYVSPLDYNSYYDDGSDAGAPYNIKDMQDAASARRSSADAVATDSSNLGQVRGDAQYEQSERRRAFDTWAIVGTDNNNMQQAYNENQPGNFYPNVPLDASQVNDWRNQFGPRAPTMPGVSSGRGRTG